MCRGHRGVLVVPHKQRMPARWPPKIAQKRRNQAPPSPKITIYGCQLGARGSFMLAARAAGYSFTATINLLLDTARQRYAADQQSPLNGTQQRSLAAGRV